MDHVSYIKSSLENFSKVRKILVYYYIFRVINIVENKVQQIFNSAVFEFNYVFTLL